MTEVQEFDSHPLQEFILNKKIDGRETLPHPSLICENLRNLWFQIQNLSSKSEDDLLRLRCPGFLLLE
jgi:hypothetical protein